MWSDAAVYTAAVVVVVLLVVAIVAAFCAGVGWGAARTYEHLRPERIAQRMETSTARAVKEMQAVHDTAIAALSVRAQPSRPRPASPPRGSNHGLPPRPPRVRA